MSKKKENITIDRIQAASVIASILMDERYISEPWLDIITKGEKKFEIEIHPDKEGEYDDFYGEVYDVLGQMHKEQNE